MMLPRAIQSVARKEKVIHILKQLIGVVLSGNAIQYFIWLA